MTETYAIRSSGVSATIATRGAELVSLRDQAGEELLWQAGPEWPRHAPALFPIVGRLAGDTLRHRGRSYRMTQHGFARDSAFVVTERSEERVALTLSDDARTRAIYPFPFRLTLVYAVEERTLSVAATVANPGDEPLPFSIGAHPGFRWPLVQGVAKDAHELIFDADEVGPRRLIAGGLLGGEAPSPLVDGRTLQLTEALFASDAVVLPGVASRSVRYVARGNDGEERRALTMSWDGYEDLGVWSKPDGAPFVCIEPWRGMASPAGWDGEFQDKLGIVALAPGQERSFLWRVAV